MHFFSGTRSSLMYLGISHSDTGLNRFLSLHHQRHTLHSSRRTNPLRPRLYGRCRLCASDRHRFPFCVFGVTTAAVGYIMLLKQESLAPGSRYFATFVIACGGHSIYPLTIAWLSNNGMYAFAPLSPLTSDGKKKRKKNLAILTGAFQLTHSGWTLQVRSGFGVPVRLWEYR